MSRNTKFDVHQEITNRIVDAIETAGEFRLPWIKTTSGSFARPVNIASRKPQPPYLMAMKPCARTYYVEYDRADATLRRRHRGASSSRCRRMKENIF